MLKRELDKVILMDCLEKVRRMQKKAMTLLVPVVAFRGVQIIKINK